MVKITSKEEFGRATDINFDELPHSYAEGVPGLGSKQDYLTPDIHILAETIVGSIDHSADVSYRPDAFGNGDKNLHERAYNTMDFDGRQAGADCIWLLHEPNDYYQDTLETERAKHDMLANTLEQSWGTRRASYVSTFQPTYVDLAEVTIRKVTAEEGLEDGCKHAFGQVAQNHIDVDEHGHEIRYHVVDENADPATQETVQELIEEAQKNGEIAATGNLAENDSLCEVDPTSEVCGPTSFRPGL